MAERFTLWDSVDYLKSDEDIRFYLEACIEEDSGDGVLIRAALSDIARIRNANVAAAFFDAYNCSHQRVE
jgi:DNA-binding phage protein